MIQLILMLALNPVQAPTTAQVTICSWPHRCASVAQVETQAPRSEIDAQVTICSWPHRCS
jgi:hypothetical protein